MKANRDSIIRKLKIARGQIDGILNMVNEDRYCIDISTQLLSTQALLKSTNKEILKEHINSCVKEGIEDQDYTKVEEVIKVLEKFVD